MRISGKVLTLKVTANMIQLSFCNSNAGGAKRGCVNGASRQAMGRFLSWLNSVVFSEIDFVTLTYHRNEQDNRVAYANLKEYKRRIDVLSGKKRCMAWKKELQERGAIHYHLFFYDMGGSVQESDYADVWMDVTGQNGDLAARKYGVDTKRFDRLKKSDAGVVLAYMCKYVTKGAGTTGRTWGVMGKENVEVVESKTRMQESDTGQIIQMMLQNFDVKAGEITGGGWYVRAFMGSIGVDSSEKARRMINSVLKTSPHE